MVSGKKIHRAFRTHTILLTKPIREIFHFHHLPKLYMIVCFFMQQLLKDLIEQHDIVIDSALEKARLQCLMNKKNNSSSTVQEAEENGCKNAAEINRTSVIHDKVNAHSPSPLAPDSNDASELTDSRTNSEDTCILAEDQSSSQSGGVTMATKDEKEDCLGLEANSHTPSACDGKSHKIEPELGNSSENTSVNTIHDSSSSGSIPFTSEDASSYSSSSDNIPLNSSKVLDRTTSNQAVVREDEAVAKEDVAKDDAPSSESFEDERTDRLAESLCRECKDPMPDPEPHEMCIFLHALTYKVSFILDSILYVYLFVCMYVSCPHL